METNFSSQADHVKKTPDRKLPSNKVFFISFVAFSFALAFIIGGIYFDKQDSSKQNSSTELKEQVKITAKELPNSPDEWETYKLNTLGIEIKLPEKLAEKGDWKEQVIPASDAGSIVCFSNEISGGAVCAGDVLFAGGTSTDFVEGRGGTFTDSQGFKKENGKFYIKDTGGNISELTNVKLREINNQNGVEIIKVLGENITSAGTQFPLGGTPGEGYLGAIINTKNPKYPGVAIQLKVDSEVSEFEFDQILENIRFIN